jgi:hypothetical protein
VLLLLFNTFLLNTFLPDMEDQAKMHGAGALPPQSSLALPPPRKEEKQDSEITEEKPSDITKDSSFPVLPIPPSFFLC